VSILNVRPFPRDLVCRETGKYVRIKFSDPSVVAEATDFFWRVECVAVAVSEDTIDVSLPGSLTERQERAEISTYLRTWQATHPEVGVEIVD
jgi:hypothetical protein